MIEIGQYNQLKILRKTSIGLFLGDTSGNEVLLPNKYCPERFNIDEEISVFVYLDNEGRKIATNLIPKILLHEFALLKVTAVTEVGTFVDWGMEKELMVPFREQRQKMEEGRWYIVYLDIDHKTNRLIASNKIDKFLHNENLSFKKGDEVDLVIWKKTDMGFSVIVNNAHAGLIFENEIFQEINIGDKMKGYVKKMRDDNKIDISLQASGYFNINDKNAATIYGELMKNKGFLSITDKSSPEEIYSMLGISKKAFKKALGALYKERRIKILEDGIKLI